MGFELIQPVGFKTRSETRPRLSHTKALCNPPLQVLGDRDPDDDDHPPLVLPDGFHQKITREDGQNEHATLARFVHFSDWCFVAPSTACEELAETRVLIPYPVPYSWL